MCKRIMSCIRWLINIPNMFQAYAHDRIFRAFGLDPNAPDPLPPIGFDEEFDVLVAWSGQFTHGQLRAMRIRINGGTFTDRDWQRLLKRDGCCLRCGATDHLSMDHIIPVVRGGRHTFSNAQVLCRSCNSWKNTKIIDFRKRA